MITLALKLILAHVIGDFVLQPSYWVKKKQADLFRSPFLYYHVLIHAALLCLFLWSWLDYITGIALIVVSHYGVDLGKLVLHRKLRKTIENRYPQAEKQEALWRCHSVLFIVDQLIHFGIIAFVVYLYEPYRLNLNWLLSEKHLLLILALVIISSGGAVVISMLMNRWQGAEQHESLTGAGTLIGVVERLIIFVLVIAGYWQAIGFLLAAKSVFRFGDLSRAKDRKSTEYILIGTLLSFGWAMLIGQGYLHIRSLM